MLALTTALLFSHATAASPLRLAPELQLQLGSTPVTVQAPPPGPIGVPPLPEPVSIFSARTVGTGFLGVLLADAAVVGLTLALGGGAAPFPGSLVAVVMMALFDLIAAPIGAAVGSALGVPQQTSYGFLGYLTALGAQGIALALLGTLWDATPLGACIVAGLIHFVGMPASAAMIIRARPSPQIEPIHTLGDGRAAPGGSWLLDVRF